MRNSDFLMGMRWRFNCRRRKGHGPGNAPLWSPSNHIYDGVVIAALISGKTCCIVFVFVFRPIHGLRCNCCCCHLCAVSTAGVQFRLLKRYYPKIALKRLSAGGQLLKRYFGPLKRYFYREADSPCIP